MRAPMTAREIAMAVVDMAKAAGGFNCAIDNDADAEWLGLHTGHAEIPLSVCDPMEMAAAEWLTEGIMLPSHEIYLYMKSGCLGATEDMMLCSLALTQP